MSLGTYSHYQDSGADWLGKIPAHWTMKRLRFAVELNPSKSEISDLNRDSEVSFLPMEAIGDDGSLNVERTRPIREVETGYTYFREGDVTVAKITPCFENGKGALMRGLQGGIGFGTTELIVARPKHEHTSGDYLNWIFRSPGFRREGEASMYGAGGQKRVPDDFVRNFLWAFPPLPEQSAIAAFLNRETTKIDVLVAEQEKLLTLLAEKRQATISHAVTRGLDHEVPMKDSGVAWLGKVPAHWVRTPIKHTLRAIIDSEHKTAPFYEGGEYLVVRTSNVKNGTLVLDDAKYTDRASFKEWTTRGVPEPGDIVFTREAPAGEACIVPTEFPVCLGQRTVLMKTDKTRLNPYYGVWVHLWRIGFRVRGGARPRFNSGSLQHARYREYPYPAASAGKTIGHCRVHRE
ncbi:hypothetical protein [Paraburkholderia youngii]|uniref:restriction endonuclease subunit S n=1 Tax=Paraburkholderia youngii TaxID=2782701 RepID=UPI003D21CD12